MMGDFGKSLSLQRIRPLRVTAHKSFAGRPVRAYPWEMFSESSATPVSTAASPVVRDGLGRGLTDLRLSVTDRCNFRCTYCMPKEIFGASHAFLPKSEILSFEEMERVA